MNGSKPAGVRVSCSRPVRRSTTVAVMGSQAPGARALHRYVSTRLRLSPAKNSVAQSRIPLPGETRCISGRRALFTCNGAGFREPRVCAQQANFRGQGHKEGSAPLQRDPLPCFRLQNSSIKQANPPSVIQHVHPRFRRFRGLASRFDLYLFIQVLFSGTNNSHLGSRQFVSASILCIERADNSEELSRFNHVQW